MSKDNEQDQDQEPAATKCQAMDFPATQLVETVQGVEPCCDEHAKGLTGLMHFMGSWANLHLIIDGEERECNNCRNEAKKNSFPCS